MTGGINGVPFAVVAMSTALLKTLQVVASGLARKAILAPRGGGSLFQRDCSIATCRALQTCSFHHTGHRLGWWVGTVFEVRADPGRDTESQMVGGTGKFWSSVCFVQSRGMWVGGE